MSRKDELWAWLAGIAGAIISGLIISAFVTDFAAGDISKIWALIVALVCFGIAPILWAADELGLFASVDNRAAEGDEIVE